MAFKSSLSTELIAKCKAKLLQMKADCMNRAKLAAQDFNQINKSSGDEIDQSSAHQEEHAFLINQTRLKSQLLEIEFALGRIEQGFYGVCEETLEPIESERLMALPFTRLSIEGAEIRESTTRRFAR
jgi:DnaK suppressor protein